MNLDIVFVLIFLIAFIVFSIKGYKNRSYLYQFIGLNSFIALTNQLKEMLPSTWNTAINLFRIIVGLLFISIFFYQEFKYRKKMKQM